METYRQLDIVEMPLGTPFFHAQVEAFLGANGLRMESMDVYYTLQDADGHIYAGAGLSGDIIKGVAVLPEGRQAGLSAPLLSRLMAEGAARGHACLKVFTKPENQAIFENFGFRLLCAAPEAILMENGPGLETYLKEIRRQRRGVRNGAVVMHANPFTRGHRHLVEAAAAAVDQLFVIPVREEGARFPYADRKAMIQAGCADLATVLEGSAYQISAATFPTYFLKDLSAAAETQMRLDIDLFARHIAPALGVGVRFVATEPDDPLTARYNVLMRGLLPAHGIALVEIPRLEDGEGPVSATRVRAALAAGRLSDALSLAPVGGPYFLADLATQSLTAELSAPGKPGLVGPDGSASHTDMDAALMQRCIHALRPRFVDLARTEPLTTEALVRWGVEAEAALLELSGGVNTYRGALFAFGLMTAAAAVQLRDGAACCDAGRLSAAVARLSAPLRQPAVSHGGQAVERYGAKGALAMARDGYAPLFRDWLPYYRSVRNAPYALQKTLLYIMTSLDDTCILHRAGPVRALEVKAEAARLLQDFSPGALLEMNHRYTAERVSPGGSADMLALTLYVDALIS